MIKKLIRRWLGVDRNEQNINTLRTRMKDIVGIGIDLHYRPEESSIFIFSHLNGGQLREIKAKFYTVKELDGFVKGLKQRFDTHKTYVDTPRALKNYPF